MSVQTSQCTRVVIRTTLSGADGPALVDVADTIRHGQVLRQQRVHVIFEQSLAVADVSEDADSELC